MTFAVNNTFWCQPDWSKAITLWIILLLIVILKHSSSLSRSSTSSNTKLAPIEKYVESKSISHKWSLVNIVWVIVSLYNTQVLKKLTACSIYQTFRRPTPRMHHTSRVYTIVYEKCDALNIRVPDICTGRYIFEKRKIFWLY